MSNTIKYSGTTEGSKLNIGKWRLDGGGPTEVTDYWNGIDPPSGGYTIYKAKEENGPSIRLANNNAECLKIFNDYGFTGNTIEDGLLWASDQDDLLVINDGFENIVTDGLVLYLDAAKPQSYPGSGTTWDDLSGNGNNGTLTNGPTFSDGAIVFDGSNDWIDFDNNDSIKFTGSYTISLTLKNNTITSTNEFIILNGVGTLNGTQLNYAIRKVGSVYRWYVSDGTNTSVANSNTTLSSTVANIVFTMESGGNSSIYVNGTLDKSFSSIYSEYLGSRNLLAISGVVNGGGTRFFNGNIYQLMMHNRALTPQEILQNYNATRSRYGLP